LNLCANNSAPRIRIIAHRIRSSTPTFRALGIGSLLLILEVVFLMLIQIKPVKYLNASAVTSVIMLILYDTSTRYPLYTLIVGYIPLDCHLWSIYHHL